jgi:hypothetical protein
MPENKPTWVYYFSKTLNMKYAFNTKTGGVVTEDKVEYTPEEIDALKGKQITPIIHELKKIFNGKVVNGE